MSSGHSGGKDQPTPDELDDLLAEVLANPKVRQQLARPFKVDHGYDIALLGSSSVDGDTVYIDRHFKVPGRPFCRIPVGKKVLNAVPGLVRHERLEQILENVYGWKYILAHYVAEHWEEQLYKAQGFDPKAVEKAYEPFIKYAEHEKITRVPTDLDARPLMSGTDPGDAAMLKHKDETANKEKVSQASVGYVNKSARPQQKCGLCRMFVAKQYGGPACTLVQDKINEGGWCRKFSKGKLDGSN